MDCPPNWAKKCYKTGGKTAKRWESAKVSHKRVFALLTPDIIHSYEMAQMLQKPVFALAGC